LSLFCQAFKNGVGILNESPEGIIEAVDKPPRAGVFIQEEELSESRHGKMLLVSRE
jgi:hypothetical protein